MCVVNSYALKLAGIDENTLDIPGGIIEREVGRPTGVIKGAARRLLRGALPEAAVEEYKRVSQNGRRTIMKRKI